MSRPLAPVEPAPPRQLDLRSVVINEYLTVFSANLRSVSMLQRDWFASILSDAKFMA